MGAEERERVVQSLEAPISLNSPISLSKQIKGRGRQLEKKGLMERIIPDFSELDYYRLFELRFIVIIKI